MDRDQLRFRHTKRGQMNGHELSTTNILIIAVFAAALPAAVMILLTVLASTV